VISRVADSCFWLYRYMDRAESCARLAAVNRLSLLDARIENAERWKPVIVVLGEQARFEELVGPGHYHDDAIAEEYLTWNQKNPGSIQSSLYWARENARMIREVISREMWETLNTAWQWWSGKLAQREYRKDPSQFYHRIRCLCAEFWGIGESSMLHEEPFDFMRLGMLLERANQTARLLDVKHHRIHLPDQENLETPWQSAQWLSQLKLCAAEESFFKRHRAAPTGRRVADFLLRDPSFPRSVLHCLDRAVLLIRQIQNATGRSAATASLRAAEELAERLSATRMSAPVQASLHDELTRVVDTVALICKELHREFFDPTEQPENTEAGAASAGVPAPPNSQILGSQTQSTSGARQAQAQVPDA
jgi:uncharacterized alpha-E superfamily protein